MSANPHQVPDAEVEARVDAIVRRAFEELRAIDPGCDCAVLFAARNLLALALDERVIMQRDADALLDLVRFVELLQSDRRVRLGLDRLTVDGPIDLRAAREGILVDHVAVRLGGRTMPVAAALALLEGPAPERGTP